MPEATRLNLPDAIRQMAHPINTPADYKPLMDWIGDAHFVLIGEASHGTHDFYYERAEITKRLIQEKGFTAVAVEADWPDAYRVNRYVRGIDDDATANEALAGFRRFPTWMWRNTDVLRFVNWLRSYNDRLPSDATKTGFYGLDLYSLYGSIQAVVGYLEEVDPEAAQRARSRYSCFDHFGEDSQSYGYAAHFGMTESCKNEVINQLVDLQRHGLGYLQQDGQVPIDEYFYAEQNARLIQHAEEYYRSMFRGRVQSWNLRDRHMADTLNRLADHLQQNGQPPKVVVWEHNSHLGDARATDMGDRGELNVGQLVREQHDQDTFLIGFSTYTGTVTAASNWDAPAELKQVRPALPDSYEALFHRVAMPRFLLSLRGDNEVVQQLRSPRLERAIGVIYLPETERASHYFYAQLPDQFDTVIHIDDSRAVEPLERYQPQNAEAPETYPSSL